MEPQPNRRTKVFICYSRKDRKWLERLRVHLEPLVQEHHIEIWDDTRIKSGSDWKEEIRKALDAARVAVLLVSADFLASKFIKSVELPSLLAAAKDDGARILPVILKPSRFSVIPSLYRFQAVNDPSNPLVNMTEGEQETTLVKVSVDIEAALGYSPTAAAEPEDKDEPTAARGPEQQEGEEMNGQLITAPAAARAGKPAKSSRLYSTPLVALVALIAVLAVLGVVKLLWPRQSRAAAYICRTTGGGADRQLFKADFGAGQGQESQAQSAPGGNAQEPRLSRTDVMLSLRNGPRGKAGKAGAEKYVESVRRRGVDFQLTAVDEQDIRRAGGYLAAAQLDELVTAVRDNYRPEPTSLAPNIEQVAVVENPEGGVQVFLRVSVRNDGPPTTAQKYRLEIKHRTQKSMDFKSGPAALNERYTLPRTEGSEEVVIQPQDAIARKTTESIPPGQTVSGWLRFVLPPPLLTPEYMRQSGIRYTLSFADAVGRPYVATCETP